MLVVVYSTPHTAATSEREREREREIEEYSIQESDERMKESVIQQALVRARQLLDDHDHDCAPSSIECHSELLRQIVHSLLHQSV